MKAIILTKTFSDNRDVEKLKKIKELLNITDESDCRILWLEKYMSCEQGLEVLNDTIFDLAQSGDDFSSKLYLDGEFLDSMLVAEIAFSCGYSEVDFLFIKRHINDDYEVIEY